MPDLAYLLLFQEWLELQLSYFKHINIVCLPNPKSELFRQERDVEAENPGIASKTLMLIAYPTHGGVCQNYVTFASVCFGVPLYT